MELLAELFELEIDKFGQKQLLEDLEEWDSLAAISYVVMMDEEFNKVAKRQIYKGLKRLMIF